MENKNKKYVQVGVMVMRDKKGNFLEHTKQNLYIEIDEKIDKTGLTNGEKYVATD